MGWYEGELRPGFVRYAFPEPECYLHETCSVMGRVTIGRFTYISEHSTIAALSPVTIGSFCSIAMGFHCATHEEPPERLATGFPFAEVLGLDVQVGGVTGHSFVRIRLEPKPIVIGNDVWIGDHVTVAGGVNIGHGAIIGAKAVVRSDCVPYGIYVGSPARLIGFRFSPEVIEELLDLRWWDWTPDQIRVNRHFFETDLSSFSGPVADLIAA
jgi:acetyltransferase-like isoleucine patch superfamily enzyme